jgi:hypothetical protein
MKMQFLALSLFVSIMGCASMRPGPLAQGDAVGPRQRVRIQFIADSSRFRAAASEYDSLWIAHGDRIVQAMESVSGLSFVYPAFADTSITATVVEAPSNSGYRTTGMRLRASYPTDTKVATLIHELGHRLQGGLFRREEEEHNYLFLWLYDVWTMLYDADWADAQVAVEKARGQRYVDAWNESLTLTREQRAQRWRALLAERMPTRR